MERCLTTVVLPIPWLTVVCILHAFDPPRRQARKLQEMFQALQQENDNLRRSARSGGPPGAFGGGGNSGQHQLAKFSPNLGGMGGAQTVRETLQKRMPILLIVQQR